MKTDKHKQNCSHYTVYFLPGVLDSDELCKEEQKAGLLFQRAMWLMMLLCQSHHVIHQTGTSGASGDLLM